MDGIDCSTMVERPPGWLTAAVLQLPGFAGRAVRDLHYEEVAAGPGKVGFIARFQPTFEGAESGLSRASS